MKKKLIIFILCISMLFITSSAFAVLLGTGNLNAAGLGATMIPDTFSLALDPVNVFNYDVAFPLIQGVGVNTFDSTTPGFAIAEGLLTNGTADRIGLLWEDISESSAASYSWNECGLFFGDGTCSSGIDFMGYDITQIIVETTVYDVDSPGSDPNGDGLWTDVNDVRTTVSVYGEAIPEPSTLILLGSSLIGLVAFRKKSQN